GVRRRAGGIVAANGGDRPEQVDGPFQLGEGSLEHVAGIAALRPGRLAQRGVTRLQAGHGLGCLAHIRRTATIATSSSRGPKMDITWLLKASTSAPLASCAATRSFSRLTSMNT